MAFLHVHIELPSIFQRISAAALLALSLAACSGSDGSEPQPASTGGSGAAAGDCGYPTCACDSCFTTCLCHTGDTAGCYAACGGGSGGTGATGGGAGTGAAGSGGIGTGGTGAVAGTGGGVGGSGAGGAGGTGGTGGTTSNPDCYEEPAFPAADVADIVSAYGGDDWKGEAIEAMRRRWPAGGYLLDYQQNDSYFDQFSDPSSWGGMVDGYPTLVHEETHLFNAYYAQSQGQSQGLYFREDLILFLPDEQGGFPRSEIYDLLAPGTKGIYADTYLTGEQGSRGFNALLDELNCYENELGVGMFGDHYPGQGVSLRDGSVAFLYYMELYLRRAREAHTAYYDSIKADAVYQDAVRIHWLRTHFLLQFADKYPSLGIDDATFRAAAHEPANMGEISTFIGRNVGDSNCLLP